MQIRFLKDQETKDVKLPKCSTWVPWVGMSVIEFKHHQSHESGMQNIWCPSPYCWLLSEQLLQACKQKSNKEDVWLRLWHFLDTIKTQANQSTNRLVAAHEINVQFVVHHHLVDDQLRQQIRAKVVDGYDVSSWATPMQKLEHILSNWQSWQRHVHLILPQIEESTNLPVLMIFYHWQTPIRSYTNNKDPFPVLQTIPWGHATNMDSGIQIVNSGGILPASTEDESGNTYHWCPSFYCRVNGNLVENKIDQLPNRPSYTAGRDLPTHNGLSLFMASLILVSGTWQSPRAAPPQSIPLVFSLTWCTDMPTDGWSNAILQLFLDSLFRFDFYQPEDIKSSLSRIWHEAKPRTSTVHMARG